jgi:hypothetical protein
MTIIGRRLCTPFGASVRHKAVMQQAASTSGLASHLPVVSVGHPCLQIMNVIQCVINWFHNRHNHTWQVAMVRQLDYCVRTFHSVRLKKSVPLPTVSHKAQLSKKEYRHRHRRHRRREAATCSQSEQSNRNRRSFRSLGAVESSGWDPSLPPNPLNQECIKGQRTLHRGKQPAMCDSPPHQ